MTKKEQENIIIQNIFETISNLTDASYILEKSKKTKKHLEEYRRWEDDYYGSLTVEDANAISDIAVNYEQSIGIGSFLMGFQMGINISRQIEDKDFVSKTLDKIM